MQNFLIKILFLSLLIAQLVIAQNLPTNFKIDKSAKLSKATEGSNPVGNSVEKFAFIDNEVWLATSNGVSKSIDDGETWTDYKFNDDPVATIAIKDETVWIATWNQKYDSGLEQDVQFGTGLHYTKDGGETWIDLDQPLELETDTVINYGENRINNFPTFGENYNLTRTIDFQNETIWIANWAGGLFKSNDDAQTWEKVVLPPDTLNEIHPDSVLSFTQTAFNNLNEGIIANANHVIFGLKVIDDSTIVVGTMGGINISRDGGISWKKFNHTNQENPISGNRILDINYNETTNTIWAATWQEEGSSEYYAVSASSDFGENWEIFLPGETIREIGFTYNSDNSFADILAAGENGVYRSSNNGLSWIKAPEISDTETKLSLGTNSFMSVASRLDNEGINNIWFGSLGSGTAMLRETGDIWDGVWKVFIASPDISSGTESIAFPNPFSPDEEAIRIKYSFNGSGNSVTIRVFDFGMNLVKTVLQNVERVGEIENIETWNGRDENNQIVPNGVYFYRIDIGNQDPIYGKIMVLM